MHGNSIRQRSLCLTLLCVLAAGCQSLPPAPVAKPAPTAAKSPAPAEPFRNVYKQDKDSAPVVSREVDYMSIPDAVPKAEPRGKYGNKSPYTVNGRTYRVLAEARGYRAEGKASWYGEKFHGHRTSSFEPYDMYAMTAAHTTLPIPSYVRVTNLDNDRAVIVRVNDRGPFHDGRIIDLSWAAAQKLGYAGMGTARVRVETVEADAGSATTVAGAAAATGPGTAAADAAAQAATTVAGNAPPQSKDAPGDNTPPATALDEAHGYFVQLGAFTFPDAARQLGERVRANVGEPVIVSAGDDALHRVRVGPYEDRASAERMRDLLLVAGIGTPALVFVPEPAAP